MYAGMGGGFCEFDAAVFDRTFLSLASLWAARCAYMFGCSDTLSMLLAWGNEERPHERLGRATSFSARVLEG